MDYHDSKRAMEIAERTRSFVDEVVVPVEREYLGSGPVPDGRIDELRRRARDRGVFGPQLSAEYGGQGLDIREQLPTFEAAGRSILGPPAVMISAPDEGNMNMLELVGSDEQRERWLRPLAAGEIRSAISMTEPLQGGGSDPKMLRTVAERDGDRWIVDGHKWWTTQGSDADVLFVVARTDPEAHPYRGCSIIAVPADADGVRVIRDIPHVGERLLGTRHAEIAYEGVSVPVSNTIGPVNEGFSVVQRRLGPARLTHCMRYAGMASRALSIATAYATEREAFGTPLSAKQAIRFAVAESSTELHAVRTMVRHAADAIAAGNEARTEVAMCKSYAAPAVQRAIDTAVQICGGAGLARDLPLADFYESVRQFRLVDGADEVHKRSIARAVFESPPLDELDRLTRYESDATT